MKCPSCQMHMRTKRDLERHQDLTHNGMEVAAETTLKLRRKAVMENKGGHENPFHEIKSGNPSEITPMTVHVVDGSYILLRTGEPHDLDIGQIWNREHAHKIMEAVNSFESDQKKIKALLKELKAAHTAEVLSYGAEKHSETCQRCQTIHQAGE